MTPMSLKLTLAFGLLLAACEPAATPAPTAAPTQLPTVMSPTPTTAPTATSEPIATKNCLNESLTNICGITNRWKTPSSTG